MEKKLKGFNRTRIKLLFYKEIKSEFSKTKAKNDAHLLRTVLSSLLQNHSQNFMRNIYTV